MIVALVNLLKLIDALLDVIKRHVWSSFALLRHVHIFVVLVIFVHHSLEKVAMSSDTHTFDCFRTICFWKGASSNSSTWEVYVLIWDLIGWRIESHGSRCFLTILDVSHALRLITTFHVAISWSRLSGHLSNWPIRLVKANLRVVGSFCHVHLTHWIVLGAIINSTDLIGMRSHCVLVHILLFVQLCLVDAGLGIKSVLINVTFLVKLLVNVCCFHQVTFNKALMNSSIKADTAISLPTRPLWCSHEPPLVHKILALRDKATKVLLTILRWHHQTYSSRSLLIIWCINIVSYFLLLSLWNDLFWHLNSDRIIWAFLWQFRSRGCLFPCLWGWNCLFGSLARDLALRLNRESWFVVRQW